MVSIEEMLAIPSLEGLKVVAGHGGTGRQIRTVSVMDAPDIYKWMKGGEFLITSGGPLKDDPSYLEILLRRLDEHGASAFGIKTGRFLKQLPGEALKVADQLSFPLIDIPEEYAFTDIINPVLGEVINRQSARLELSEQIHKSFTELALKEAPVEEILETLEQIIHCRAAFLDTQFCKLFVPPGQDHFYSKLREEPVKQDSLMVFKTKYPSYEISNESKEYGLILMDEPGNIGKDERNIALEHAGTILILDAQKRLSNSQIASRFRDEFIHDVIYHNINTEREFYNRAALYRWKFTGGLVAVVDIDNFKLKYEDQLGHDGNMHLELSMQMICRSISKIVKLDFPRMLYSKLNDAVIFLISENCEADILQKRIRRTFEAVQSEVERKIHFTATVAVGRYKERPMDLHESYKEARRCIDISHNLKRENTMVFYDRLGIYKLIHLVAGTEEARELLNDYVYKLRDYDTAYGSELLKTFIAVCENSWNLKLASDELYIHYNTIKYRFGKITRLLENDFKDMGARVNAEIAICIYQMRRQNGG